MRGWAEVTRERLRTPDVPATEPIKDLFATYFDEGESRPARLDGEQNETLLDRLGNLISHLFSHS